jgi:uncharacterized protein YmfQ (DUF2313 family)
VSQGAEAYARMLRQLLPTGPAWEIEQDDVRAKLLLAMGEELARVEARGEDLLEELDPRTSLELLTEWERAVGLPDAIVTEIPASVTERRIAILQKLLARGGASPAYFIELAQVSGFIVTITEYTASVARAGRLRSGDRIYGPAWAYAWKVNVSLSSPALEGWAGSSIIFRSGQGRAGDRLKSWNGPVLEAFIRLRKPAHTIVLFSYA